MMKKMIIVCAAVLMLAGASFAGVTYGTLSTNTDGRIVATYTNAMGVVVEVVVGSSQPTTVDTLGKLCYVFDHSGYVRVLNETNTVVLAEPVYDTNTTTTATAYTPLCRGQMMFGGAGSGTNAVWSAKGTTTNDWVQLEP